MKYYGYAECYKCKDQNGPWILKDQKFLCEDCYEKEKKNESKNIQKRKHRNNNKNT